MKVKWKPRAHVESRRNSQIHTRTHVRTCARARAYTHIHTEMKYHDIHIAFTSSYIYIILTTMCEQEVLAIRIVLNLKKK